MWFSIFDPGEGGSISTRPTDGDSQLSVSSLSCFVSVCPPVALIKAIRIYIYAEHVHIVLSCHVKKRSFSTSCVFLFVYLRTLAVMSVFVFFVFKTSFVETNDTYSARLITVKPLLKTEAESQSQPPQKPSPCFKPFISFLNFLLEKILRREAGDFWCLPIVWNLGAFSLIPLFCILSFVLMPRPVALSVLSFWPILPTSFPLNLHFPKGRLFLFVFWAVRRWVFLVGHMALVLVFI